MEGHDPVAASAATSARHRLRVLNKQEKMWKEREELKNNGKTTDEEHERSLQEIKECVQDIETKNLSRIIEMYSKEDFQEKLEKKGFIKFGPCLHPFTMKLLLEELNSMEHQLKLVQDKQEVKRKQRKSAAVIDVEKDTGGLKDFQYVKVSESQIEYYKLPGTNIGQIGPGTREAVKGLYGLMNLMLGNWFQKQWPKQGFAKYLIIQNIPQNNRHNNQEWLPCRMHCDHTVVMMKQLVKRPAEEQAFFMIIPLEDECKLNIGPLIKTENGKIELSISAAKQRIERVTLKAGTSERDRTVSTRVGDIILVHWSCYHATGKPADDTKSYKRLHISLAPEPTLLSPQFVTELITQTDLKLEKANREKRRKLENDNREKNSRRSDRVAKQNRT
jgi:hypothetical protein